MRRWVAALAVGSVLAGCSVRSGKASEPGADAGATTTEVTSPGTGKVTTCLDGSDDGFIVYSASAEGGEAGTFDLWAIRPDGGSPTQLTDSPGTDEEYPQVSPDGSKVAYTELREDTQEVRVLDCGRRSSTSITSKAFDSGQGASWSPDGKRLALYGQVGDRTDLFLVSIKGNTARALGLDDVPYSIPAWSPDGTQVATTVESGDGVDIVLVPIDGSRPTRLTEDPGIEGEPSWSPDGSQLAFYSDADGENIWTVAADGSDLHQVTADDFMGSYQPAWAPDGKRLVHVRNGPDYSDLVIVSPAGGEETALIDDGTINEAPDWWGPRG